MAVLPKIICLSIGKNPVPGRLKHISSLLMTVPFFIKRFATMLFLATFDISSSVFEKIFLELPFISSISRIFFIKFLNSLIVEEAL